MHLGVACLVTVSIFMSIHVSRCGTLGAFRGGSFFLSPIYAHGACARCVHGVTGGGVRLLPAPKLGLLLDQRRHATLRRQRPRQKRVHYPCHETMVRTRPLIFQQALQEHGAHNVACRKPPSGS